MNDELTDNPNERSLAERRPDVLDMEARADDPIVSTIIGRFPSPHTRRAYARALVDFLRWYDLRDRPGLSRWLVSHYIVYLQDGMGYSAQNINQRLAAIRALVREASANGWLDEKVAASIESLKGVKAQGQRIGRWLTVEQAQAVLNAPDIQTIRGMRDRALLAVLLGGGLRRSEIVALTFAQVQQRDGRWAIVDMRGKGNKFRSIPIASWVKVAIDEWRVTVGVTDAATPVFRPTRLGGRLKDPTLAHTLMRPLTAQTIHDRVTHYSAQLGVDFAPHDLRRTYAKLARKGGAPLEQIQFSLGHASVQTTEKYVGMDQDFGDAPGDRLGLTLARRKGR